MVQLACDRFRTANIKQWRTNQIRELPVERISNTKYTLNKSSALKLRRVNRRYSPMTNSTKSIKNIYAC